MFNFLKKLFGRSEQRAMTLDSWGNMYPLARLAYGQEREILGIPAALCAVRVIAEAFSDCPVEIIEDNDQKRIVKSHPLNYLLNVEANPDVSAVDFKQTSMHHLLLWGNSFSESVFTAGGEIDHFRTMLPNYTTVLRNEQLNLIYRTTLYPSMEQVYLDAHECLHVKALSYDGLLGLAPLQLARTAFDLAHNQENYANNWFENNSKPGAYINYPRKLSQQARDNIVKSFQEEIGGAHNANRLAILDDGGVFNYSTIPADDGQWLASRSFQLGEIARIFNINPTFLQDMSGGWTSKNLETINTQFVQRTLCPWLRKWELELKRKILGPKSNLSVHFNVTGLMRADHQTRLAIYSTGLQNGIYCINECRRWEGLPDIGPDGDEFRVQLNVAATGADGQPTPSNPSPDIKGDEGEEPVTSEDE